MPRIPDRPLPATRSHGRWLTFFHLATIDHNITTSVIPSVPHRIPLLVGG